MTNIPNMLHLLTEDEEDDDFGPNDFGFIIGPDGELKKLIFPENINVVPPTEVQLILDIFGIDINEMNDIRTLH